MGPFTLYEIRRIGTASYYLGITGQDVVARWGQHVRAAMAGRLSCAKLARSLRKHGPGAFEFSVRAMLPSWAEAQLAERVAIALEAPPLNIATGGQGCARGPRSAAVRAKMGRPMSAETRARISVAKRGVPSPRASVEVRRLKQIGTKHSPETLAKMSASSKLRAPASAETRAKMSASAKARVRTSKRGGCGKFT